MQTQSFIDTFKLIRSDMQYRCQYEHKILNVLRVFVLMTNHAVLSQVLFRWQGFFYTHYLGLIARIVQGINSLVFTVNIDSSAQIGEGFLILHANYIFVGRHVRLGKRCIFTQQNAIGPAYILSGKHAPSELGPAIGDEVLFGVGCTVLGDISLGNNTKISVNSAVDKSFPDNAVLVGVPAKNLALI